MAVHGLGNSLVANTGTLAAAYWHNIAAGLPPLAGTGMTIANRGVGGMSISVDVGSGTLMATRTANVIERLVPGRKNVMAVLEGANEAKGRANNAAAMHQAMADYCRACKDEAIAIGIDLDILVGTAPPAGADPLVNGSTSQGRIDARNIALREYNKLIRENFRSYADVLWDTAAVPGAAAIFANGDFRQAVFEASGYYALNDGQPNDWTHLGPMGNRELLAIPVSRALVRVRID